MQLVDARVHQRRQRQDRVGSFQLMFMIQLVFICQVLCAAGSNQLAKLPDGVFHKREVSCL